MHTRVHFQYDHTTMIDVDPICVCAGLTLCNVCLSIAMNDNDDLSALALLDPSELRQAFV